MWAHLRKTEAVLFVALDVFELIEGTCDVCVSCNHAPLVQVFITGDLLERELGSELFMVNYKFVLTDNLFNNEQVMHQSLTILKNRLQNHLVES